MIVGLIYIYIVICLAMVLFDIFFIAIISLRKKISKSNKESLTDDILTNLVYLDEHGKMDTEYLAELQEKLHNPITLQTMETVIDSLNERLSGGEIILPPPAKKSHRKNEAPAEAPRFSHKKCAMLFEEYLSIIATYIVGMNSCYRSKDIDIYSYYIHFLRKYKFLKKFCNNEIISNFKDVLEKGDVHACENILLTVYDLGNPDLAIEMLKLFDKSEKYLNPKIISDGLLDYSGDAFKLQCMLLIHLGEFSVTMQVNILNYIRFVSGEHCEFILRLLLDKNSDNEVKFSCMRYFGKYKYPPAYPIIAEYANGNISDIKEFCIIAVSVIRNYPGADTVDILKKQIYSHNWNIRYNAAESLDYLCVKYEDVMDILEGDDRYTREMMQYRFDKRYAREKEEVFL